MHCRSVFLRIAHTQRKKSSFHKSSLLPRRRKQNEMKPRTFGNSLGQRSNYQYFYFLFFVFKHWGKSTISGWESSHWSLQHFIFLKKKSFSLFGTIHVHCTVFRFVDPSLTYLRGSLIQGSLLIKEVSYSKSFLLVQTCRLEQLDLIIESKMALQRCASTCICMGLLKCYEHRSITMYMYTCTCSSLCFFVCVYFLKTSFYFIQRNAEDLWLQLCYSLTHIFQMGPVFFTDS